MIKLMSVDGLDRDKAFVKSQKATNKIYTERVAAAIEKAADSASELGANHVLFLDKNHPNPQGIKKAISELKLA